MFVRGKRISRCLGLVAAGLAIIGTIHARALDAPDGFTIHDAPREINALAFVDEQGRQLDLAGFRGRTVLLNLWATWCPPCRHEMPTLDRLQEKLGDATFEVVALSIDQGGVEPVSKFYGDIGIRNLAIYLDTSSQALVTLRVRGIPTTLLIDRAGREIGRVVGPAEWDTPEMIRFFEEFIAREGER
jgi:thiol-disulfide isomerase/thioredoxin